MAAIFGRENQRSICERERRTFCAGRAYGEFCRSKKGGRPFCVERFLVLSFLFFKREREQGIGNHHAGVLV